MPPFVQALLAILVVTTLILLLVAVFPRPPWGTDPTHCTLCGHPLPDDIRRKASRRLFPRFPSCDDEPACYLRFEKRLWSS